MNSEGFGRGSEDVRSALMSMLEEKQRQLRLVEDKLYIFESRMRDCSSEISSGRDRSHGRWLAAAVVLLTAWFYFRVMGPQTFAVILLVLTAVIFFRWVSEFIHCCGKRRRAAERYNSNKVEYDRLAEEASVLRLEIEELKQRIKGKR